MILAWALYRSISIAFPSLGKEFHVLSYALLMNAAFATMIRLAHVYSAFEVATVYAEWKSSHRTDDIKSRILHSGFYIKYGKQIRQRSTQAKAILVHSALQLAIWLTTALTAGEFSTDKAYATAGIIIFFYLGPMCYMAAKLVNLEDGLYLKREVTATVMVAISIAAIYVLMSTLFPGTTYASMMVVAYGPYPLIGVLIVFPLYKSYVWERHRRRYREGAGLGAESFKSSRHLGALSSSSFTQAQAENPQKKGIAKVEAVGFEPCGRGRRSGRTAMTLKQVLDCPQGVDAFKRFCKQELTHESILFFLDARAFLDSLKNHGNGDQAHELRAVTLYEKYVKPGAELQINIGHSLHEAFIEAGLLVNTKAELSKIDPGKVEQTFKDARDEIYKLMATDSFVRFLRHKLYVEFVEAMKSDMP